VGKKRAPGPQQTRFAAYIEGQAKAAGHADRNVPLKNYCTGLLLPGDRKSVEPMAARLAPDNVRRMHQSLHHVVAEAVSLSVTTDSASMPVAYRLYLPEVWIKDDERRKKTGVPEEAQFQTKPNIALEQIRRARQRGVPEGVVLADAGYGTGTEFRQALTKMEMTYVMGVQSTITVWKPGEEPKPAPPYQGMGRPPKLLRRDPKHQPISAKNLALSLPAESWKKVTWRQGVNKKLQSRFAAVQVRPAHFTCQYFFEATGAAGEAPLDRRARLRRTVSFRQSCVTAANPPC
jgi:SRSO17 transposase